MPYRKMHPNNRLCYLSNLIASVAKLSLIMRTALSLMAGQTASSLVNLVVLDYVRNSLYPPNFKAVTPTTKRPMSWGRALYAKLIEPLMSGIYAGDGRQLSLLATFPQMRQLEQKYGSLLAGLQQSQPSQTATGNKPTYPPFVTLPTGMGALIDTLADQLSQIDVRLETGVTYVQKSGTGYEITLADGTNCTTDQLILTTPAYVNSRLLQELDSELAQAHASKWAGRAPAGYVLLRVYMGRYGRPDVLQMTDDQLVEKARTELANRLQIHATPHLQRIYRWPRAMPQYTLGHLERLARIEERLQYHPGLYVAGAAYRGVGIPDCIAAGEAAAKIALAYKSRR